jgi:hypothetical protein
MSSGDEMDSCTRLPTARCAWDLWPCPVVSGSKYRRFLRPCRAVKFYVILELLGGMTGCPGPSRVREGGGPDR